MIELGEGWESYLSSIRICSDDFLHDKDDNNLTTNYVRLDGGGDDIEITDYRGLSLVRNDIFSENNLTKTSGPKKEIELNGASVKHEFFISGGDSRLQNCKDDVNYFFYDGGDSSVQSFMGDAVHATEGKATGSWLNSILPFLGMDSLSGHNSYIARSESRALKTMYLDISLSAVCLPLEDNLGKYVRQLSPSVLEVRLPTYFSEVCNFYEFEGISISSGAEVLPIWGFVKGGEIVFFVKTTDGSQISFNDLEFTISKSPNIVTVKTYTLV